jgi:hypothetical protein
MRGRRLFLCMSTLGHGSIHTMESLSPMILVYAGNLSALSPNMLP